MSPLPAIFVSHGSPTLVLDDVPARDFLRGLGAELPRPRAIVVVSAHYDARGVRVNTAARPRTIHDFYGFPKPLYDMRYDAPGDPALATDILARLHWAGLEAEGDESWGFDHGTWVPLILMYPDADIPVVAVSIDSEAGPEHHRRLGAALAPLREDGVLILGSGAFTHNLGEIRRGGWAELDAPDWVTRFVDWTAAAIAEGRTDDLVHYRDRAPDAVRNHPTDEHFLPLFAALGAGGTGKGRRLHASTAFTVLAMDAYAFG
ncbi:class III extradiol ring-cleavage dioxygenase [Thalassobaculum sp. OXR-137]|uniref:DODA-type extradiol aromatic ring-opening family dioxygenase n=1 Tax=Thalassobaculum sp. OXR-137 TaxID=3100173 RepID=UPI002AC931E7|nr:class III extradiol ring-cleavage dioxygenase [Thalassobaculum sp. OXR-137]WPZ36517.1 class III extradiol ring-cleavage dioxygenase [Thalassobaculum sp. OXR-137]